MAWLSPRGSLRAELRFGMAEGGKGAGAVAARSLWRYIPVTVGGGSSCSGRGCGCSSRLCISVGCISTLQERRELALQTPLPPGDRWTHTHTHANIYTQHRDRHEHRHTHGKRMFQTASVYMLFL